MRVLLAPDRLPGSLSATQVAEAMAEGWRRGAPADTLRVVPLGDGGPGLVEAVAACAGGELVALELAASGPEASGADASGADASPGPVAVLLLPEAPGRPGRTVVLEAAQVLGTDAVGPGRSPAAVSSAAFGVLLEAVLALEPARLVVGVGGVRAHDAGVGALAALGAGRLSRAPGVGGPDPLRSGGLALAGLAAGDFDGLADVVARFAGIEIEVAVDTDVALLGLHGASASLGLASPVLAAPVTAGTAQELERALGHATHEIGRVLGPGTVRAAAAAPGAGAGGGLAFALALLGARLRPGAELLAELGDLSGLAADCDLLLTGGPGLDPHALHGSAISVVAALGLERGLPVVVVAREVVLGRREWSAAGIAGAYPVAEDLDALDRALADPYGTLAARTSRVARTWSR